jgi:ectoine hydroxylase-related dioxygenase (phytanoyl-CoA dioxygenase family)
MVFKLSHLEKFFIDSGFVHIEKAIDSMYINKFTTFLDGKHFNDHGLPLRYYDENHSGSRYLRKVNELQSIPNLTRCITDITTTILTYEKVIIHRLTAFYKHPNDHRALGWHQDAVPSWESSRYNSIIIWFPLCDCDSESGALTLLPGSHRQGLIGDGNHLSDENRMQILKDIDPISLEVNKGDLVLFSPFLVHGSTGNTKSNGRWAINAIVSDRHFSTHL